jgi:hypothetical protein
MDEEHLRLKQRGHWSCSANIEYVFQVEAYPLHLLSRLLSVLAT